MITIIATSTLYGEIRRYEMKINKRLVTAVAANLAKAGMTVRILN